jgi:hypothetical protein
MFVPTLFNTPTGTAAIFSDLLTLPATMSGAKDADETLGSLLGRCSYTHLTEELRFCFQTDADGTFSDPLALLGEESHPALLRHERKAFRKMGWSDLEVDALCEC